jgi:hypothetical protein
VCCLGIAEILTLIERIFQKREKAFALQQHFS